MGAYGAYWELHVVDLPTSLFAAFQRLFQCQKACQSLAPATYLNGDMYHHYFVQSMHHVLRKIRAKAVLR